MSDADGGTTETGDTQYSEVSLRAVELLARAQRTADEAVAEAQAYARDLEASARAQYAQILQRAQVAARDLSVSKGSAQGEQITTQTGSIAIVEEVDYVRTYARVAHAQLKTVLSALSDELDHLAAMASGKADDDVPPLLPPSTIEASWPAPPDRVAPLVTDDQQPDSPAPRLDPADDDDIDGDASGAPAPRAAKLWTPDADDSDSSEAALSGATKTGWRSALQRKS